MLVLRLRTEYSNPGLLRVRLGDIGLSDSHIFMRKEG